VEYGVGDQVWGILHNVSRSVDEPWLSLEGNGKANQVHAGFIRFHDQGMQAGRAGGIFPVKLETGVVRVEDCMSLDTEEPQLKGLGRSDLRVAFVP